MLPHNLRPGRALLELLTTLLIGLTPVCCGLLVVVWQVDKKLEEAAEVAAREVIHTTDALLDTLDAASNKVLNLAHFPCDKALGALRTEVVSNPEMRSLVLLRENRAYCGTVHGEAPLLIDPGLFLQQRLRLESGNDVTPDSPILYYRLQEYPVGVLALTDGKNLQESMRAIKSGVTLVLEVGAAWLSAYGNLIEGELPDNSEQQLRLVSDKYGYAVLAGYPAGYTWEETLSNIRTIAPSILLVGILTSALTYWTLFRHRPRRRR